MGLYFLSTKEEHFDDLEWWFSTIGIKVNTYDEGCFKKSFTLVMKMLLRGECYENVYT
jgi:hypothetical protein